MIKDDLGAQDLNVLDMDVFDQDVLDSEDFDLEDVDLDPLEWNETLLKYVVVIAFGTVFFPMILLFILLFRAVILESL